VSAIRQELLAGLKFILTNRAMLLLISSMVAAIFALGAFDALIAVDVRDILAAQSQVASAEAQSRIFGAIVSIAGVGTIIGSLLIGRFGQHWPRLHLVMLGILSIGLSIFLLSALGRVWVTLACSFGFGLGVAGALVPSQTLIQEETPPELLGRVSSTSISLMTVAQLAAISVSGTVANWIGIRNLYYLVALLLTLTASWGYVYTRMKRMVAARTA
jgi:DHA3 family macrolide efflux protein-like MFS transporter